MSASILPSSSHGVYLTIGSTPAIGATSAERVNRGFKLVELEQE